MTNATNNTQDFGAVSLRPDDMSSGGFLDGAEATIQTARFVNFDYKGNLPTAVPVLKIAYQVAGSPDLWLEHYSLGRKTSFEPSADGTHLRALRPGARLNNQCNAALFIAAVCDAGFSPDALAQDISVLEGLEVILATPTPPSRGGEGPAKPLTVVESIVSGVETGPDAAAAPTTGGGAAGGTATTNTQAAAPSAETEAENIIAAILAERAAAGNPGLAKSEVVTAVSQHPNAKTLPNLLTVVQVSCQDKFLAADA
ncbi:MAG: hypothetical protein KDA41_20790, partial [Planctomycetales bacterium]|nr:hypothetical protein [Planctomycetales bacterium]